MKTSKLGKCFVENVNGRLARRDTPRVCPPKRLQYLYSFLWSNRLHEGLASPGDGRPTPQTNLAPSALENTLLEAHQRRHPRGGPGEAPLTPRECAQFRLSPRSGKTGVSQNVLRNRRRRVCGFLPLKEYAGSKHPLKQKVGLKPPPSHMHRNTHFYIYRRRVLVRRSRTNSAPWLVRYGRNQ